MKNFAINIDTTDAGWFDAPIFLDDPERDLILEVIHRAFKDARGATNGAGTPTARLEAMLEGRDFILDGYKIEWGNVELNATELCIIATGTDKLIKDLQKALKSKNIKDLGRFKKRT